MIEALIALLLSVLFTVVFGTPGWLARLGSFGALGFVFWVLVLVAEWIFAKVRK